MACFIEICVIVRCVIMCMFDDYDGILTATDQSALICRLIDLSFCCSKMHKASFPMVQLKYQIQSSLLISTL